MLNKFWDWPKYNVKANIMGGPTGVIKGIDPPLGLKSKCIMYFIPIFVYILNKYTTKF